MNDASVKLIHVRCIQKLQEGGSCPDDGHQGSSRSSVVGGACFSASKDAMDTLRPRASVAVLEPKFFIFNT